MFFKADKDYLYYYLGARSPFAQMSSQAIIQARVFHGSKTNELIYSRNSISRIPELSVGFSRSKNVFVKHMHSKNAQCRAVRKNKASDDDTSPPIPTNRETDMEALLNKMSLEYDSVWDTKPAWYRNNSFEKQETEIFQLSLFPPP